MKAICEKYQNKLRVASAAVQPTLQQMQPAQKVFQPTDRRFLTHDPKPQLQALAPSPPSGQRGPQKRSEPSPLPQGAAQRPRRGASLDWSSEATTTAVGTTVTIDDDDAEARPTPNRGAGGSRARGASQTKNVVSQELQQLDSIEAVHQYFFASPGVAARLLTHGKRKIRGEVDPVFILVTSIQCGNQLSGVTSLAANTICEHAYTYSTTYTPTPTPTSTPTPTFTSTPTHTSYSYSSSPVKHGPMLANEGLAEFTQMTLNVTVHLRSRFGPYLCGQTNSVFNS